MTFHPAVLNEAQKTLLPALGKFAADNGFSLGGGTAVALYLGHRSSIDFDWFLTGPLEDSLGLAEQARSRGLTIASLQVAPGTLHAVIQNVRVSFFPLGKVVSGATNPFRYPLLRFPLFS